MFELLALIPELISGANSHPKTVGVILLAFVVFIFGSVAVVVYQDMNRPVAQPVAEIKEPEVKEPVPRERRIIRFAKWLWSRD